MDLENIKDGYGQIKKLSYMSLNYSYVLLSVLILSILIPFILWLFSKVAVRALKANNRECESGLLFFFNRDEYTRCVAKFTRDNKSGPMYRKTEAVSKQNRELASSIESIKARMAQLKLDKENRTNQMNDSAKRQYEEAQALYNQFVNEMEAVKKQTVIMRDNYANTISEYMTWFGKTMDNINQTLIQEANDARDTLIKTSTAVFANDPRTQIIRQRAEQKWDAISNYFKRYNGNTNKPADISQLKPLESQYRESTNLGNISNSATAGDEFE